MHDPINVTLSGSILPGPKVQGVEYMSDVDALAYLRDQEFMSVQAADGTVLAKSMYAITPEEQNLIDSQVVRFGPNIGKTLGQVAQEKVKQEVEPEVLPPEIEEPSIINEIDTIVKVDR